MSDSDASNYQIVCENRSNTPPGSRSSPTSLDVHQSTDMKPSISDSGVGSHCDNLFVDEIDACNLEVKRYLIECQCYESDLNLELSSEVTESDEEILRSSISYIDDVKNKYITAHDNLMNLLGIDESPSTKSAMARRHRFLCSYKSMKNALLTAIRPTPSIDRVNDDRNGCSSLLDLPEYDGDAQHWVEWKRSYVSLVHENRSLDDSKKLEILRSKLTGEPKQLLAKLPSGSPFYQPAWDILSRTYGDPVKNFHRCLETIDNVEPVDSKYLHASLRSVINRLSTSATALEEITSEACDFKVLDQFLIYAFLKKCDPDTRSDWQLELSCKQSTGSYVDFKEFIRFMNRRCQTLEDNKGVKRSAPAEDSPQPAKKWKGSCLMCSSVDHPTHACKKLLDKDPKARLKHFRKNNWCFRCVNPRKLCNRKCDFCCRICGSRGHSSILHGCWN